MELLENLVFVEYPRFFFFFEGMGRGVGGGGRLIDHSKHGHLLYVKCFVTDPLIGCNGSNWVQCDRPRIRKEQCAVRLAREDG